MSTRPLSDEQIAQFDADGYLLTKHLLDAEETSLLQQAARADALMQHRAMKVEDASGRSTNLSLWNHPGDDIYGMIARSRRIVDAMEQLLGGEVYHYHSKLSAKQPKVGGAWEWHQDYGYWYQNGCLFPLLASVMIAVDPATRENGCLQVLKGSHLMGRVDHGRYGDQTGADPQRVAWAKERLEHVYCEMNAGDGLYFHCNTLHASAPNESERPRWMLLCCYNAARNDPFQGSHHPKYTPLAKVDDDAIRRIGPKGAAAEQVFLRQEEDATTG